MINQNVAIEISNLNKTYPGKVIFNDFNIKINRGELICILGVNGSGKTTLLKCIAGLEEYRGTITKQYKNIGYISQDPKDMIFPWMTIKNNIIFPLKKNEVDKALLEELLEVTRLKKYEHKYPYELSGGMTQILLVARALMSKSDIILMDEPFKSLDFAIAKKIQSLIFELWQRHKPTIIIVSHDIEEAIFLASRIIIFPRIEKKIGKIIPVNLPVKRETSIISDNKFINIKKTILHELFQ